MCKKDHEPFTELWEAPSEGKGASCWGCLSTPDRALSTHKQGSRPFTKHHLKLYPRDSKVVLPFPPHVWLHSGGDHFL